MVLCTASCLIVIFRKDIKSILDDLSQGHIYHNDLRMPNLILLPPTRKNARDIIACTSRISSISLHHSLTSPRKMPVLISRS